MTTEMRNRDEILDKYIGRVNELRSQILAGTPANYAVRAEIDTLGWVLGFSSEDIEHDIKAGI